MSEFNTNTYYQDESVDGLKSYVNGVFVKMGIAMLITTLVAFAGYYSLDTGGFMYNMLFNGTYSIVSLILVFVQLGLCIALSAKVQTMNPSTAKLLFYIYAAVTGFTFSVLPLSFGLTTVFSAFAFAAVMFFACAIIGHTTNVDLSKFSGLLMGGLIALVIAGIASIFIPGIDIAVSFVGVILFLFLTAWDMQKIKQYYYGTNGGYGQFAENLSTMGAFQLYLDFINLFLYVLRILGSRSRRN